MPRRLRPRDERPTRVANLKGEHHGQVPVPQALSRRARRLQDSGEFVDSQALAPDGAWVRYDGEGRPPVTDGPFAETKDLIAGWMIIDVDSYERAVELAGELSAAPGAGGKPIHEWLEVRPFLTAGPKFTE
jgi:hypothetical protein